MSQYYRNSTQGPTESWNSIIHVLYSLYFELFPSFKTYLLGKLLRVTVRSQSMDDGKFHEIVLIYQQYLMAKKKASIYMYK